MGVDAMHCQDFMKLHVHYTPIQLNWYCFQIDILYGFMLRIYIWIYVLIYSVAGATAGI